jgi:hypothetical protein
MKCDTNYGMKPTESAAVVLQASSVLNQHTMLKGRSLGAIVKYIVQTQKADLTYYSGIPCIISGRGRMNGDAASAVISALMCESEKVYELLFVMRALVLAGRAKIARCCASCTHSHTCIEWVCTYAPLWVVCVVRRKLLQLH